MITVAYYRFLCKAVGEEASILTRGTHITKSPLSMRYVWPGMPFWSISFVAQYPFEPAEHTHAKCVAVGRVCRMAASIRVLIPSTG